VRYRFMIVCPHCGFGMASNNEKVFDKMLEKHKKDCKNF